MKLGRVDEAEAFDEELATTDRDMLSDCTSCVVSKTFSYLIAAERWGDALACYEKEMTPRLRCTHEPQRFLSHALTVLRRHGRFDDARDAHVKSYRHIARNPAFVYEWGDHVEHLALTDQVPAARRLLQKHVDVALTCFDPEDKYVVCTAAHICLEQIHRGGSKTVKLSLATPLEIGGNAKGCHTSELSRWFLAEAEAIAAQFDRRNGNDWVGSRFHKRIAQSA